MEPKVFTMAQVSGTSLGWLWGVTGFAGILLVGTLALLGWSLYAARHTRFDLTAGSLVIRGGFYGRTVPVSELAVEGARRVDLEAAPEFRPSLKTNGIGVPGYQSGWFRLKNGDKALLFLTDKSKAVYIPTRKNYVLLVSPADPDAFLAALRGS